MKNQTNTYLILAVLLAGGSIIGLWYFSEYIYGLTEKTTELREQVETQELKIKRDQLLSKSAQNTNVERQKLSSLFIQPNASIDFVSSLEKSASDLSLLYSTNQIENISPDSLSSQGKELLKISMTISGKWSSVLRFLRYIETLPYVVKIERVDLVSGASVESTDPTTAPAKNVNINIDKSNTWKLQISFSVIKIKDDAQ